MNNLLSGYGWYPFYANYSMIEEKCCALSREQLIINYQNYLFQKAISLYRFILPNGWSEDYFTYNLFGYGMVAGIYHRYFGWICQRPALEGYTLYEFPRKVIVNNEFIKNYSGIIGKDCILFSIQPTLSPITDLIYQYAQLLAECHLSIMVNLYNTKVTWMASTNDKDVAEQMKKVYQEILDGQPSVFYKKRTNPGEKEPLAFFTQNVKENYIVDKILLDMRMIEDRFDTDFGIPNANTVKKERLVTDEVNSNNIDTKVRTQYWFDRLQSQISLFNKISGENMKLEWRMKDNVEQKILLNTIRNGAKLS